MRSTVSSVLLIVVLAASAPAQSIPPPPPPEPGEPGTVAVPPPAGPTQRVLVPYRAGRLWGFATREGGLVVGSAYRGVDKDIVHEGGLARVALDTPGGLKWGVVGGADGHEVLPPIYDEITIRSDGIVFFRDGREKGAAAPSGRIVAPLGPDVPTVERSEDGLIWTDRDGGPRGLFTADGAPISVPAGADESFRYEGGVVAFSSDAQSTGYGIVTRDLERVVRYPQYSEIYPFAADRALVSIPGGPSGRLYGFVDRDGHQVVEPRYTSADVAGFSAGAGVARVGRNGKSGLIDVDGHEVLPPKYDFIGKFTAGFAVVGNGGSFGLVDLSGRETIPVAFDTLGFWVSASMLDEGAMAGSQAGDLLLLASSGGKLGVLAANGDVRVPLEYDEFPAEPYLSYAYVRGTGLIWGRKGTKFALVRRDGKVLIPPTYDSVLITHESWSSGGFPVEVAGRWGFVDRRGRQTIPPSYDWIAPQIVGGFVIVAEGGRYGAFDPDGRQIVPVQYDAVEPYENGVARVRSRGLYGFATYEQGLVTSVAYQDGGPFTSGVAPVRRDGRWGLLDKRGVEVLGPTYDRLETASSNGDGAPRFLAVNGRLCGYVDGSGVPLTAMDYEDFSVGPRGAGGEWIFRNGMACVSRGGRYGFVDVTGKEIMAPVFDVPATFSGGEDFAYVVLAGLDGFVDKTGRRFFDGPIDRPTGPAHTSRRKRG